LLSVFDFLPSARAKNQTQKKLKYRCEAKAVASPSPTKADE
jgi:hypothetical protein